MLLDKIIAPQKYCDVPEINSKWCAKYAITLLMKAFNLVMHINLLIMFNKILFSVLYDFHCSESEEKRTEDTESESNQTAELCDADTVESSLPPDSRQKRLADLQAERAACDPARLQTLKVTTCSRSTSHTRLSKCFAP